MQDFVALYDIFSSDTREIVRLKKKFNRCATLLNKHITGTTDMSSKKQKKLLEELVSVGKAINAYQQAGK